MTEAQQLLFMCGLGLLIGVPLGLYLKRRRPATAAKWNGVASELSWPFYAAGLIMFSGIAVFNAHQPLICAFFAAFALLQLVAGLRSFAKQRSQFSTRHLLVTMVIVALIAVLCRWFGMAMAVVAWAAGSAGVMVILFMTWRKRKCHTLPRNSSLPGVLRNEMFESYIHQLIPSSPTLRPRPEQVARFVQGLVASGNLPTDATIRFVALERSPAVSREAINPFNGEPMTIRSPSRQRREKVTVADSNAIATLAASAAEYNVVVSGSGAPKRPPLAVGRVEGGKWTPWTDDYSLDVVCHVREVPVVVSVPPSPSDFDEFSVTDTGPRPGDDAETVPADGFAHHPNSDPWVVPGVGAAAFWIDFELGKWIYPPLKDGKVEVMDESVMQNAREAFGCEFVQSCTLP